VYDTRADVYSWGVLLAELVAQKPPYDGMYLTPTQVSDALQQWRRTLVTRGDLVGQIIDRGRPETPCTALCVSHKILRSIIQRQL
jgi:hypothetical protein